MNHKMLKRCLLLFVLGCVLIVGLKRAYYHGADHFSLRKIAPTWDFNQFPIVELSTSEQQCLHQILSQPFSYLGKGNQFYVFKSQDEQHVLKFFKQSQFRKKEAWIPSFLLSSAQQQKYQQKNLRKKEQLLKIFESSFLAYQKLSEETGIELLHLNRHGDFSQKVTLIDKLGFKNKIDVGEYEFVLQKKAIPLEHVLLAEIPLNLDKILEAVEKQWQKGVVDLDENYLRNIGFNISGEVIFMDFGLFISDESFQEPEKRNEQKQKYQEALKTCFPTPVTVKS